MLVAAGHLETTSLGNDDAKVFRWPSPSFPTTLPRISVNA